MVSLDSIPNHHKFIGFMILFQVHVESIISLVRIVYTQMSYII
jgi:hypothetical protein